MRTTCTADNIALRAGATVCFTGKMRWARSKMTGIIRRAGLWATTDARIADALVLADCKNTTSITASSKLKEAQKSCIPVISESEFFKWLDMQPSAANSSAPAPAPRRPAQDPNAGLAQWDAPRSDYACGI